MIGTLFGALAVLGMATPADAQIALRGSLPIAGARTVEVRPAPPKKIHPESIGMRTTAQSAFVADVASGKVLYEKNPHRVLPVASLTKLVTAMVFLDTDPDLTRTVIVKEEDQDHESRQVYPDGEVLTLEDVLRSMLVGSVNTSANILARVTGGDAFIDAMNTKVKDDMGLQSPVFVDPTGLDPKNQASAADVAAILSKALSYDKIREFSQLREVVVHSATSKKEYRVRSTNMLLSSYLNAKPYGIVVAKTGSLPEAGFNMAQVTKNEEGHQIVAVELGSTDTFSRFQDIKALTTWAFDTYRWQ
jgi:D-alanyl-D-alanine carboxypeptidase